MQLGVLEGLQFEFEQVILELGLEKPGKQFSWTMSPCTPLVMLKLPWGGLVKVEQGFASKGMSELSV